MKNIFNKLIRYIEEEDILGLVRYCLILLPFIAIFIVALYCMVTFVTRHKEGLIIIFIGVCFLCSSIMGKKKEPPKKEQTLNNNNVIFFDRLLIQALFSIFTVYSKQFHVIPPTKFSDLQDTLPSGLDAGKQINIYRFQVISDGEAIEEALFKEILTVKLHDKLASGEVHLGNATAEFNGQLYPKIFVDYCSCAGGAWHIILIICDNILAANYINNKQQNLAMNNYSPYRQYHDGDF